MPDEPRTTDSPDSREQVLSETRSRLTRLEAEAHRLRAQLARLEAKGQEQEAERLEAQLAELHQQRSTLGTPSIEAAVPTIEASSAASESAVADSVTAEEPAPLFSLPPRPEASEAKGAPEFVDEAPVIDTDDEKDGPKTLLARFRGMPAWAASLVAHAIVLFVLSVLTFVTLVEPPPVLNAGMPDGSDDYFDEFSEVDFEPSELEPTELSEVAPELTEITEPNLSEIEDPLESMAVGATDLAPGVSASLPTDLGALMTGDAGGAPNAAGGKGENAEGGGKPGSAQFFGARSKGNRFVFVVDNSASMKDGRMETTLMELQRAVGAMNSEQMFYVIFYSDQAYPMFFPKSVDEMAPATRENKQKLANWLPTVEMALGGRLGEAIKMAEKLDPAVVYLLSDGDIRAQSTLEALTTPGRYEFVVNTFGMTVRKQEHAAILAAIARANQGAFNMVGINPVAARMAVQRPIPYHNKGPGPVWGSKVRPR